MPKKHNLLQTRKQQALQALQTGNFPEAKTLLAEICQLDSHDADAWSMLGAVHGRLGKFPEAVTSAQRAIKLRPKHVEAYYNLGTALTKLGHFNAAVDAFRTLIGMAAGLSPQRLAEVHSNLGNAQMGLNQFREAAESYQYALRLSPGTPKTLMNLGDACMAMNRLVDALNAYQQAVQQDSGNAQVHYCIGAVYERLRRPDEAERSARQALALDANHASSSLLLARLVRRAGRLDETRDQLEQALAAKPAPMNFAALSCELGHVFDRSGDHLRAFAAWEAGKQALATLPAARHLQKDAYLGMITAFKTQFTAERLAGWSDSPPSDALPSPIFLVGHPRSGATRAEQLLSSHPAILSSNERPLLDQVIRSFSSRAGHETSIPDYLGTLDGPALTKLRQRYWDSAAQEVGPAVAEKTFVDKVSLNILYLGIIQRLFPQARVLVAIRDPRDVCLDCFRQFFKPNRASVHFHELESTARHYAAVMDLWLHYRRVLSLPWLHLRYEELVADTGQVAERLIAFTGEGWEDTILSGFTPDKQTAVGRWRNYQEQLAPALEILAPYVREFGYEEQQAG